MIRLLLLGLLCSPLYAELDLTLPPISDEEVIELEKKFRDNFNFIEIKEPPTRQQKILYWTLHGLDVYTTYEGLKNPNITEGNPLLNNKPSLEELVVHKIIFGGLLGENLNTYGYTLANTLIGITVVRNIYTINTTSPCTINFYVDGSRVPC